MKPRLYLLLTMLLTALLPMAAAQPAPAEARQDTQKRSNLYRLLLKDKNHSTYTIDAPAKFLSRKSLERRRKQGIAVDSTDLPVSPFYLNELKKRGAQIIATSRWLNSVVIACDNPLLIKGLCDQPFVASYTIVWQSPDSTAEYRHHKQIHDSFNPWDSVKTSRYAASDRQISTLNGKRLHEMGYTGKGMTIAVLDGGFENADVIHAFRRTRIEGSMDFVYPQSDNIFHETDHGTKVLSLMAANTPHVFIGTAPAASYWLLRCEDQKSEQPVEEDYWVMAAEYADSVGADLINSSIGYTQFDHHLLDHQYGEMDGQTAFISRAASMLADKGIVLVNSAGNNGMGPWKKISFPADAMDILTVGAVTTTLTNAPFCSVGPTQDGRVKPDVMAIGSPAYLISGRGTLTQDMGTSFSTPLVCGLTACLWQALPHLTAKEIIRLVRQSGSNPDNPDNIYGYGLPDFETAWKQGKGEQ